MLRYTKLLPRGFILFALLVFILPGSWLNPIGLFLLTPLRPVVDLFASTTSGNETAKIQELQDELLILRKGKLELTHMLQDVADFVECQPDALNIDKFYQVIIAGVIISHDATPWRRSLMINRGSSSGISRGLPVISGKRLVGKVSQVGLVWSRVQLITDPAFRGKAIAIPNPEHVSSDSAARVIGVLAGYSTNQCMLKWVSRDLPVRPGWQVFSVTGSSGAGTACPKNLIVGEVTQVKEESYFYRLIVKPAVDFTLLESVMVLKKLNNDEN